MNPQAMNRRAQLLCVWMGPVLTVLFFIGFVPLAGFLPPPAPTASPEEIGAMYRDDTDAFRIGMVLCMAAFTLLAPWGLSIAMWTRRTEAGFPILTYTQVVSIAILVLIAILSMVVWLVASFRPDDVSAEVTRTLNDLGWFLFVIEWPPVLTWLGAVALAILWDESKSPAYPRWAAYLSLWTAVMFISATGIAFFKTGAFAWNGLLALYVPMFVFFTWLVAMSVLTIRAINRHQDEQAG